MSGAGNFLFDQSIIIIFILYRRSLMKYYINNKALGACLSLKMFKMKTIHKLNRQKRTNNKTWLLEVK